jgi:hypothetical protein
MRAADRAKFLFASPINSYLSELYDTMIIFQEADETYNSLQGKERSEEVDRRRKHLNKIMAFYKEFDPLVEPYLGMRQRQALF